MCTSGHTVCGATPSLSHLEGPSLLSVLSPARCVPLTSQRRCRHMIFSFKSLSIVLIFRFDSPNFFRKSGLGKCLAPPVGPLRRFCSKPMRRSQCGISLFSLAARVLGPEFCAHCSNFLSPISEVVIIFSFPLRCDREERAGL